MGDTYRFCTYKHNGSVRICGDYRVTVDQYLKKNKYAVVSTQAYQHLQVEQEGVHVLTINTHKGLCRVKQLGFGISAAAARIFQRYMD